VTRSRAEGQLIPSSDFADTLDDAQRKFATARRRWPAQTGKDEQKHRPFYGRPVNERMAATPGFPEPD